MALSLERFETILEDLLPAGLAFFRGFKYPNAEVFEFKYHTESSKIHACSWCLEPEALNIGCLDALAFDRLLLNFGAQGRRFRAQGSGLRALLELGGVLGWFLPCSLGASSVAA